MEPEKKITKVLIIGNVDIARIAKIQAELSVKEGTPVELITEEEARNRGIDVLKTEKLFEITAHKIEPMEILLHEPKHGLDKWERKYQQKYFNKHHSKK